MERTDQSIRVAVTDRPLDPAGALAEVGRPDAGAQALFVGTARDHSEAHPGVTHLDYEAFPDRAEQTMRAIAAEAVERWEVLAVVVEHRVGRVEVGEPSVVVAVSSAHRQDSFEAARYLIDELKARAPLWKKEHWEGGAEWVAGA